MRVECKGKVIGKNAFRNYDHVDSTSIDLL